MSVVKYGQIIGPIVNQEFPLAASQIFKHRGGAIMQLNSSGHVLIAPAGVTDLIGCAVTGEWTSSAVAGEDKIVVNMSLDAVFEMPIDTARTAAELIALVGKFCDIIVTSDIQYADYDAQSDNIIQIVGYNYYGAGLGQQSVLVKLVSQNLTTQT